MKNFVRCAALLLVLGLCTCTALAESQITFQNFDEGILNFNTSYSYDDEDYENYVKTLGEIHVRKGPGLDYKSLTIIKKGKTLPYAGNVSVDDRGVVWYEVEYKNGKYGWVSSTYAQLMDEELFVYGAGGQSNIRKQPYLGAKHLETLLEGDLAVYLHDTSIDDRGVVWYKVRYEGVTGWVSSRYTILSNGDTELQYVEATDGSTKIRDLPSLDGEYLGELNKGRSAIYMGSTSVDDRGVEWYRVLYGDVNGWVSSRYTELD